VVTNNNSPVLIQRVQFSVSLDGRIILIQTNDDLDLFYFGVGSVQPLVYGLKTFLWPLA
jgi:hypothetical protein